jgi:hypothetical protein
LSWVGRSATPCPPRVAHLKIPTTAAVAVALARTPPLLPPPPHQPPQSTSSPGRRSSVAVLAAPPRGSWHSPFFCVCASERASERESYRVITAAVRQHSCPFCERTFFASSRSAHAPSVSCSVVWHGIQVVVWCGGVVVVWCGVVVWRWCGGARAPKSSRGQGKRGAAAQAVLLEAHY